MNPNPKKTNARPTVNCYHSTSPQKEISERQRVLLEEIFKKEAAQKTTAEKLEQTESAEPEARRQQDITAEEPEQIESTETIVLQHPLS
jgi:putative NADPH-quinone reductase